MPGPVALVGAGEFLPAMEAVDVELLVATGRSRPRVAILPTAVSAAGEAAFRRAAAAGTEHFARLGAEVEAVLVRDRDAADDPAHAQAIGEADLVYLPGGPMHSSRRAREALAGSAVERALHSAHARGSVIAGSSAGAIVLGGRQPELRRRLLPWPLRWPDALGVAPDLAVVPGYDAFPEVFVAAVALQSPAGLTIVGIDRGTVVVGRDGAWQVHGPGRATVWRGRHRERYRAGEVFRV